MMTRDEAGGIPSAAEGMPLRGSVWTRRRTKFVFAAIVVALYLLGGALSSVLAPFGWYTNYVYNSPIWADLDPGYWYMAGSHNTLHGSLIFAGHPGLPLRFLLYGLQEINVAISSPGPLTDSEFSAFTARSLGRVFTIARMLMVFLNLGSFYLLFHFSRCLTRSDRSATIAVLLYASSWPVLFYATRVATEPLMVICFLGTFLSAWKCGSLVAGSSPKAAAYAFLAALAAVSGFFTKVHFHLALPLWALPPLLGTRIARGGVVVGSRQRRLVAGVYLVSAFVLAAGYAWFMDWNEFLRIWSKAADSQGVIGEVSGNSPDLRLLERAGSMAAAMGQALDDGFLSKALSGRTGEGIFLYCEWALLLLGALGCVELAARSRAMRGRILWLALYTLVSLPLIAYRFVLNPTSFHYLFLPVVLASVFTGSLLDRGLAAFHGWRERHWLECSTAVVAVGLLHLGAVHAAMNSKANDIVNYRLNWRPLIEGLKGVSLTQRVGVITDVAPHRLYVIQRSMMWMGPSPAPLTMAIDDAFHYAVHDDRSPTEVADELRQAGVTMVVDFRREGHGRDPVPLAEWMEGSRTVSHPVR